MVNLIVELALLAAVMSTGLMAGVYFAFSAFVMSALKTLPDSSGIASMNGINKVILKSAFMPLFFGSCLLALLLIFFVNESVVESKWVNMASAIYLLGMLVTTIVFNVPLNNRLKICALKQQPEIWQYYLTHWTRWNHIRFVSSIMACLFYILALK
ncbi:hypothetical protein C0J08_09140 [Marinomonas sp. CT5]|uniref:anthrone oxygenase family protein n=2 Tax=unclassified Marinomonas TaxID=196814 RepID=UPI00183C4464|nr:anthrone oxygenase family protein [Marinomonas sp. CT5]NVK74031.1 DUF1772 domain-containing protein [Oceanospirillaceae bacterium]QUX95569.1 hypothetical protein C0J08_09140 [Marinomonas sp. CT5]